MATLSNTKRHALAYTILALGSVSGLYFLQNNVRNDINDLFYRQCLAEARFANKYNNAIDKKIALATFAESAHADNKNFEEADLYKDYILAEAATYIDVPTEQECRENKAI